MSLLQPRECPVCGEKLQSNAYVDTYICVNLDCACDYQFPGYLFNGPVPIDMTGDFKSWPKDDYRVNLQQQLAYQQFQHMQQQLDMEQERQRQWAMQQYNVQKLPNYYQDQEKLAAERMLLQQYYGQFQHPLKSREPAVFKVGDADKEPW